MAMGSPLGPLFANIFLTHYESQWLRDSPVQPVFYRRYVDDTLWFLPQGSDVAALLTYMNSRHPNMHFTVETESNNCIPFIGLNVMHNTCNNVHTYFTSVYHKPSSTALCTNFNSFMYISYKLSAVKCLLWRALHLCSNWSLIHSEISSLRNMFLLNAYPSDILDRLIRSSVSNFIQPNLQFGPKKDRMYIGLPFLGKPTDALRRTIKTIGKKFFPSKDLIVYFTSGRRVSNFFQIKDSTPFGLRSHVVYQYTCTRCQSSYIGKTSRHLRHRISEHAGVSHITGRIMKCQSHSNIRDHCLTCAGSQCLTENFKILARGRSDTELLIKEHLLIERHNPSLNGNQGSVELLLR